MASSITGSRGPGVSGHDPLEEDTESDKIPLLSEEFVDSDNSLSEDLDERLNSSFSEDVVDRDKSLSSADVVEPIDPTVSNEGSGEEGHPIASEKVQSK